MRAVSVVRWVALVAGVSVAVLYLNSALFSAWVSGGPPTPVPLAWRNSAFTHLCYSAAALLIAFAFFRGIRAVPRLDRIALVLLILGMGAVAAPHVREFFLVDRCLDAGGRWNAARFICET